jgi:hypothetical protein
VKDLNYSPYISHLIVALISGKMTNPLIIEIAKAIVTEFEVKGKLPNPQEKMIEQCVQAIKSSYPQIPKDKKIILLNHLLSVDNLKDILDFTLIYNLSLKENDDILLSKLIQMLSKIKNSNDEDYMWIVRISKFNFI